MQELQELARKLLADGTVKVVIGYEEGPRGVRPAFVTHPDQAGRLIFDNRCVQNLAAYLSPRRVILSKLGKPAIVVKGCDAKAAAGLIRETQIKRDGVVFIGVRCGGVFSSPECTGSLTADNTADRCASCDNREPKLADHLVGVLPPAPPESGRRAALIEKLQGMTADQRFAFWAEELSRCIRCHACREVCPMCFCERCVADKTQPQWIESSPHLRGNFAWQMTRVLHQAGRCVDCGECERACPAGIPLGLINKRVAMMMEKRFGHRAADDPNTAAPIGTFRADDDQEFIL
jgi:formate dehydrogenase (coenzyme F420) beta subunit